MIRSNIMVVITEAIQKNKSFDKCDFEIISKPVRDVVIKYSYNKEYYFQVSLPTESTKKEITQNGRTYKREVYMFEGFIKPGRYNESENFQVDSLGGLSNKISEWLDYLDSELSNVHIMRKINSQDDKIEEIRKGMEEFLENASEEIKKSADQYFTAEEISNINERLNDLEETLIKKINEYEDREKERDNQIEELKNDIEKMRKASNSMTKKNWLKKIITTAIIWSTDPVKQKQFSAGYSLLTQIVKKVGIEIPQISGFLPENIDSSKK